MTGTVWQALECSSNKRHHVTCHKERGRCRVHSGGLAATRTRSWGRTDARRSGAGASTRVMIFSQHRDSVNEIIATLAKHQPVVCVMIFSQYRDSVNEITATLAKHQPVVCVMMFVGQATTSKASRGLSQKEQLEVVQRFRRGGYNTLVATCVAEEGLDIGEVDLIVCFDASASPIRLVQRMGRKRSGRTVILVTEGKEE